MRTPHVRASIRCLIVAWLLAAWCAAYAESGTISGVVRDAAGKHLEGATIHLTCEQTPTITAQTSSGKDGAYRFTQILPGTYHLAIQLSGFNPPAPATVTITTVSASPTADFTLNEGKQDAPKLKFEAAGVRGLIDPGGYSAPANAAAASGLISGIADIKRVDNGAVAAATKSVPCSIEPELKRAVEANPQKADANRSLGEFYLQHGNATEALLYLGRARQIDSTDLAAVRDMAEALLMDKQFDRARELLNSLAPTQIDADIHQLLARAEEGSGQFKEASRQYQLAVERNPTEINLFGVGYELILTGLPQDAAKAFAAGLARYPQSLILLIGAGTANFLGGNSSEAVKLFLQATDLSPSDPRPYAFLVRAFGASGAEADRVRASLKRHLDLVPNDADANYFYALSLFPQSAGAAELDRVEMLLKRALALNPALVDAHFQLGTLYAQRGDADNAAREFEASLRLRPDMKEAHYRLAAAYKKTGRTEQAAHEMQLFNDARESQTAGNGGISIEQFISVADRPDQASTQATQCSSEPH